MLERAIPHELGGSVTIEYLPGGVVVRIDLSAQHLVDRIARNTMSEVPSAHTERDFLMEIGRARAAGIPVDGAASASANDCASARQRFTALVVEDNMLIAMDAEEALQELGASDVKLCPNVASALDSIGMAAFDVALLDVNLGDETSEAIAEALRTRGTPFVMTTGFGDYVRDISAYAGAPVLTKPYLPAALSRALAQVLGQPL